MSTAMLPRRQRVSRYGPFSNENRLGLLHQKHHKLRALPQSLLRHCRLPSSGQKSILYQTFLRPACGRTDTTQTLLAASTKPPTRTASHSMVMIYLINWIEVFPMRYEPDWSQGPFRVASENIPVIFVVHSLGGIILKDVRNLQRDRLNQCR